MVSISPKRVKSSQGTVYNAHFYYIAESASEQDKATAVF